MKYIYSLILLFLFSFSLYVVATSKQEKVSDGPYVTNKDGDQFEAVWVCDDKVHTEQFNIQQKQTITACDLAAELTNKALLSQLVEYNDNKNIVALSDMHGQYELSRTLLQNNGVIDENNNWALGDSHLVITGDVFDRGDKVTEILWLLYQLEQQAEQVGGKVHLLLGNHEVMVLNGDLRYLHPKYVKVAQLLETQFEQLFAQSSVLGKWLRSKSVLVKINGYLFAHGGFHPELAENKMTLSDINQLFKANLVKSELDSPRQGWGQYVHKSKGPIWYRGYFKDDGASDAEIETLLKHFDVKKIVVGHTSQKQVETRYQGKVVAIDSSIKRGKYGEVLFIEINDNKDKLYRGKLDGNKVLLK